MASIVDKPKLSNDKDLLEIEKYTNGLIKFIENSATPITIGVQGEWGSGKTSLLNTIRQELCDKKDARHYGIWINTWEYSLLSHADETLIKIIIALIEQIGITSQKKSEDAFKKVLSVSKRMLSGASKASGVIGAVAGATNAVINSDENESVSIRELRASLQDVIYKAINTSDKTSFIFFIDDLDRLDPAVAVSILELLKNLFDLDKCVFVLAIDYSVVVKGLQSKFGAMTEKNEWEFRAFFDKIIQLPFSMPISSYNISNYLQALLVDVNYFSKDDLDNGKILNNLTEIVSLSVGTNPRALKRLANSVSLIEIIRGDQHITANERVIEFALICIQIAYPIIYGLIQKESNFTEWNDQFIYSVLKNKKIDENDLESLIESEEFDEEWEQNLWRICQINSFLKERAFFISRLLNFIKENIPEIKGEKLSDTLDRLISMSSVTNVSSDSSIQPKKTQKDLTKYSFYGQHDLTKGRLALAIVTRYVQEHPEITFASLKNIFNDDVRTNFILTLEEAEGVIETTGRKRHFIKKDEVIRLHDGTSVAVNTGWSAGKGNTFERLISLSEKLGYEIN